jgi:hypothetical protein
METGTISSVGRTRKVRPVKLDDPEAGKPAVKKASAKSAAKVSSDQKVATKSKSAPKVSSDQKVATKSKSAPKVAKTTAATAPRQKKTTKAGVATALDLQPMIATAAYYLAEQRNFAPGYELQDWLAAEQLIRTGQPG